MAAALIDNRGARTCRRFRTVVSLAYGTPLDRLVALRDALRAFAAGHPRVLPDKVEVHIVDLGASSVELLVQVYFRVATYTEEMVCRDEFSREILRQAERLGVELAFPTQTIHLAGIGRGGARGPAAAEAPRARAPRGPAARQPAHHRRRPRGPDRATGFRRGDPLAS